MKVVVTGASGYLGCHVLQCLRARGHQITLLGRSVPPGHDDLPLLRFDMLSGADPSPLLDSVGASHLLHLAWVTEYGKYWASPANFQWVAATLSLLQAFCRQGGQHVVVAGTCAEYDWSYGYLRENTTPFAPASNYGVAKDATRRLAVALCALHGASLAWGHVFFPFGPGEAQQRLVPRLIDVLLGRAPAFGINAGAYRGMLYVPDAAQAFLSLLEHGEDGNFNICSGQPVQLSSVVRLLAQLCGSDAQPVLGLASRRPDDPPMLVGENLRLRAIGWEPGWTLERGLADMVQRARSAVP